LAAAVIGPLSPLRLLMAGQEPDDLVVLPDDHEPKDDADDHQSREDEEREEAGDGLLPGAAVGADGRHQDQADEGREADRGGRPEQQVLMVDFLER